VRLGYRTIKVSQYFVPKGLTQQDAYAEVQHEWQGGLAARVFIQTERWAAPVLASRPQYDITTQFEISFKPQVWGRKRE
jgi:hypothetical protein